MKIIIGILGLTLLFVLMTTETEAMKYEHFFYLDFMKLETGFFVGKDSKWRKKEFKFSGTECLDVHAPHLGIAYFIKTFDKIFCLYESDDCSDPSTEMQSTKEDGNFGKPIFKPPYTVVYKSAKYCGKDPIIPVN